MSIMKSLNAVEQEQFASPPVFNSVQRKQYLISLSGRSARSLTDFHYCCALDKQARVFIDEEEHKVEV